MHRADRTVSPASLALLCANFLIGLSVVAPAGMIDQLSVDLDVSVSRAALLFTLGAVVMCFGSPLVAWAFASTDRRPLLAISLGGLTATHALSALAPGLEILLLLRLLAMAFAAVVTPQAASAISMIVPETRRSAAISFIFLGWSLAAAAGLPAVAGLSHQSGCRRVHMIMAAIGGVATGSVALAVPGGLRGQAMSLASWKGLLTNRLVLTLLAVTIASSAGQFVVFPFFGPILAQTADASPSQVALCFALFGVAGFAGNVVASTAVVRLGALRTSLLFFASMLVGATAWTMSLSSIWPLAVASFVWGMGFAASNSMQQARLAAAAPALAGVAIALNSSSIYLGQAAGSAVGGAMFDATFYHAMGWAAAGMMAIALALVRLSGGIERRG